MRVLAVDPGAVRVGLAVTDPEGLIASPLGVIPGWNAAEAIAKTVEELGVGTVVIGLPLNMDGSEGPSAVKARELAEAVATCGVPVEFCDERLTSVTAERVLIESGLRRRRRREVQDAVAATVLLEAYLARKRNQAARAEAGEEA
jgi:putative Holliday junction resolvase